MKKIFLELRLLEKKAQIELNFLEGKLINILGKIWDHLFCLVTYWQHIYGLS